MRTGGRVIQPPHLYILSTGWPDLVIRAHTVDTAAVTLLSLPAATLAEVRIYHCWETKEQRPKCGSRGRESSHAKLNICPEEEVVMQSFCTCALGCLKLDDDNKLHNCSGACTVESRHQILLDNFLNALLIRWVPWLRKPGEMHENWAKPKLGRTYNAPIPSKRSTLNFNFRLIWTFQRIYTGSRA